MIKTNKNYHFLTGLLMVSFILASVPVLANAQIAGAGNPSSTLASVLCNIGLGKCESAVQVATFAQTSRKPGNLFSNILAGVGSARTPEVITIINAPEEQAVYRIIGGVKHKVPTEEIFFSYGLTVSMIQPITKEQLAKYRTANTFMVSKDNTKTIYYLTEGGLLRPIINNEAFFSYGNRTEDVIVINQKEFNYYPRNQFVFVERPDLNIDIFQITGGIKRFVTPMAVIRMDIRSEEIAPINIVEFNAYPSGKPIIF